MNISPSLQDWKAEPLESFPNFSLWRVLTQFEKPYTSNGIPTFLQKATWISVCSIVPAMCLPIEPEKSTNIIMPWFWPSGTVVLDRNKSSVNLYAHNLYSFNLPVLLTWAFLSRVAFFFISNCITSWLIDALFLFMNSSSKSFSTSLAEPAGISSYLPPQTYVKSLVGQTSVVGKTKYLDLNLGMVALTTPLVLPDSTRLPSFSLKASSVNDLGSASSKSWGL